MSVTRSVALRVEIIFSMQNTISIEGVALSYEVRGLSFSSTPMAFHKDLSRYFFLRIRSIELACNPSRLKFISPPQYHMRFQYRRLLILEFPKQHMHSVDFFEAKRFHRLNLPISRVNKSIFIHVISAS